MWTRERVVASRQPEEPLIVDRCQGETNQGDARQLACNLRYRLSAVGYP